jgi:aspartyl-tRNA(Asn)/glutamyl-tRNA(Gln) amidotransferase subunit C
MRSQEGAGVKITEKEVRYVADLANLSLTDDEVRKFQADLDEILGHVAKLNEIDTTDVEPMAQVLYDAGETATWRADRERPPLGNTVALANAPQSGAGYFKVPKVIER